MMKSCSSLVALLLVVGAVAGTAALYDVDLEGLELALQSAELALPLPPLQCPSIDSTLVSRGYITQDGRLFSRVQWVPRVRASAGQIRVSWADAHCRVLDIEYNVRMAQAEDSSFVADLPMEGNEATCSFTYQLESADGRTTHCDTPVSWLIQNVPFQYSESDESSGTSDYQYNRGANIYDAADQAEEEQQPMQQYSKKSQPSMQQEFETAPPVKQQQQAPAEQQFAPSKWQQQYAPVEQQFTASQQQQQYAPVEQQSKQYAPAQSKQYAPVKQQSKQYAPAQSKQYAPAQSKQYAPVKQQSKQYAPAKQQSIPIEQQQ